VKNLAWLTIVNTI